MKRIVYAVGLFCAVTAIGCGQLTPNRVVAPAGEQRAQHPIAGGMRSARIGASLPHTESNPTTPGLVQLTPIGNPTWRPVDFHVFSAPVGTGSDGYAEFLTTILSLLPPPNHVFNPSLGVGPGAPHAPPYTSELATGVSNDGFSERHQFNVSEFSNGAGVYCVWMIVPDPGATGSSPDFASGAIIPNSLFPIHCAGTTYRNGQVWDPFLGTFDVPALNAISPPFAVDGASHFPLFYFDNMDFAPPNTPPTGAYSYGVKMTDASGNGWDILATFTVSHTSGLVKL